jgi:D-glycero-D-manno-heptose 1,7-bisphosphate phosphatase
MLRLIILSRDGVINEDADDAIRSADRWVPIAGSLEAIARLTQAGYHIVVATNQPGIAAGLFDLETLHAMQRKMDKLLAPLGGSVDAVFFCPHGPADACDCRKPKPGLFLDIARRYQTRLQGVPAVGRTPADLEAARAAGARPVLVRTGKGRRLPADSIPEQTPVFESLADFAEALLASRFA